MMNSSVDDVVNRLVEVNKHFLNQNKQTCLDASNTIWLASLKNVTWNETTVGCKKIISLS